MKRFFVGWFGAVAIGAAALTSNSQAFPFPTDGPALFFSTPENGASDVSVSAPVTFFFTEAMAPTQSIQWSDNVNTASLTYTWMFESQMLSVTAQGGFPANATITWRLNPTANDPNNFKSAEGTMLPVGTFQGSFTTGGGGSNDPCDPDAGDDGRGFGSVYKTLDYTQTGDAAPVLAAESSASFVATYRGASNQTVTAVSVTGPGSSLDLTSTFGFFLGTREVATPEALDAQFPAGTYTVNATGAGTANLTLPNTAAIPVPRFNNLTALAALDPTQNFTLTFSPFTGAGAGDAIFISISAVGAQNEFHAPNVCKNIELPISATSVVIPANTFAAGQQLRGYITFSRNSFNTNSIPGTSLAGGLSKQTTFEPQDGGEPRPPMWTTLTRNPDGTLSYTISGDTGLNIIIEASDTPAEGWTEVETALLAAGSFQFTINPNTSAKRFFRARVL